MYKREEESIDHLLLHYASAGVFWQLVFAMFVIDWVILFNKTDVVKLEWTLHREEMEEDVAGCFLVSFFGQFGRREMGGNLKMWKIWNNHSNPFLRAVFFNV